MAAVSWFSSSGSLTRGPLQTSAKPFTTTTTTNMAQQNYRVSILEGQKRTLRVSPRSERINGLLLFFLPSTPAVNPRRYVHRFNRHIRRPARAYGMSAMMDVSVQLENTKNESRHRLLDRISNKQ